MSTLLDASGKPMAAPTYKIGFSLGAIPPQPSFLPEGAKMAMRVSSGPTNVQYLIARIEVAASGYDVHCFVPIPVGQAPPRVDLGWISDGVFLLLAGWEVAEPVGGQQ